MILEVAQESEERRRWRTSAPAGTLKSFLPLALSRNTTMEVHVLDFQEMDMEKEVGTGDACGWEGNG